MRILWSAMKAIEANLEYLSTLYTVTKLVPRTRGSVCQRSTGDLAVPTPSLASPVTNLPTALPATSWLHRFPLPPSLGTLPFRRGWTENTPVPSQVAGLGRGEVSESGRRMCHVRWSRTKSRISVHDSISSTEVAELKKYLQYLGTWLDHGQTVSLVCMDGCSCDRSCLDVDLIACIYEVGRKSGVSFRHGQIKTESGLCSPADC